MDLEEITLASLCGGAVEEQFLAALREVVLDMDDDNRPRDRARGIDIKIRLKRQGEQAAVVITAKVETKLSPLNEVPGYALLTTERGVLTMKQIPMEQPRQIPLASVSPINPHPSKEK